MIEVKNLSKSYGPVQALDDVGFHVKAGEIVGLLGPNGAGKTTLMKILSGFLEPDTGSATIDGFDVVDDPILVQERIGYLPENAPLYPELSVQAHLGLVADLRGLLGHKRLAAISGAVQAVGLSDRLTQPIGELSKGYRQRVGIAQAILHDPKVLILDEPTNGLDPTQILEVRALIRRLAGRATVILSTHILSEVEAVCDRVIILLGGRVRSDSRLSDLSATSDAVVGFIDPPAGAAEAFFKALPGVASVEKLSNAGGISLFRVHGSGGENLCPAIYDLARDRGFRLAELRRDEKNLESVFNDLVVGEGGGRS